jgi:NitT/TauT family transport system ATP-binding protein
VKSVYTIDIPGPRVVSEIRYEKNFIDISRTIWEDLRDEVQRGAAREEALAA